MQKVSKTYQSSDKQVLKNIYLSFFYGAKIGILGSGSAFVPGSIVLRLTNTNGKSNLKISVIIFLFQLLISFNHNLSVI